jgi:hypothetical protein
MWQDNRLARDLAFELRCSQLTLHRDGERRGVRDVSATAYFVPQPCAGTICGLRRAASNIFTKPYWRPKAVGVKVIVIVQELCAPRMPTQLSVSLNSAALRPLIAIELIPTATVSGLVSAIGSALPLPFATGPKISAAGECGSLPLTPLPERWKICGRLRALSKIFSLAILSPKPVGVKVRFRKHLSPGAITVGQVEDRIAKSSELRPTNCISSSVIGSAGEPLGFFR